MENLEVQICNVCESTNVHYHSELAKYICVTCGQHMTEEQTAFKYITAPLASVIRNMGLSPYLLILLLCFSMTVKSQIAVWKDSLISVPDTLISIRVIAPKAHITYPVYNVKGLDKLADTLLIDASTIKYIKINNGTSILLADLIKPRLIDLAAYFDSIKVLYSSAVAAYPSNVIPVGNNMTAIKLPTNFTSCEIDTAIFRLLNNIDTSTYYYDNKDGILKAKPRQINKVSNLRIITFTVINKQLLYERVNTPAENTLKSFRDFIDSTRGANNTLYFKPAKDSPNNKNEKKIFSADRENDISDLFEGQIIYDDGGMRYTYRTKQ